MHTKCLNKYINQNNISCPMCKKSIMEPSIFEEFMDGQIALTPMPEEYKDIIMPILCNDCLAKSTVPFHILGGKC